MSQRGFALLGSIILVVIMSGLLAVAYVQVTQEWYLASDLRAQLRSTVLAENGVEYARHLLPQLVINELLVGGDGSPCSNPGPEWRNPLPLDLALRWDTADEWIPACDDGLPPLGHHGWGSWEEGFFLIRFSNNPEEDSVEDNDHVVIARSMGVVPHKTRHPFAADVRNCITTLETRLRQERLFELPSPLTLLGDEGFFDLQGENFLIEGGDRPAATVFGVSGTTLADQLAASLSVAQASCFRGLGDVPSIVIGEEEGEIQSLMETSFWQHLENSLPVFADCFPPEPPEAGAGLYYLPEGGVISEALSGLLVAKGPLQLQDGASFRGVLLHLGEGELSILEGAEVNGGVWLSNLDLSGSPLQSRPLSLRISDSARILYDLDAINLALRALPATQLGWRIIFPEMQGS